MKVQINNGDEISPQEAVNQLSDYEKLNSVSFILEGKKEGDINMSGTDIPKEFLIKAIQDMRKAKATEAKITLENCRNLGGVDITIIIKERNLD